MWPYPFQKILNPLPQLNETAATCDSCLMARSSSGYAYRDDMKCCTFWPFLFNFQVGKILKSKNIPTKQAEVIREFIKSPHAQPMGIAPSHEYQKKFIKLGLNAFGRSYELLCPYFDKHLSRCGVWEFRGSVCTSFYCVSSYGIQGIEFWGQMEAFMTKIENTLSYDALLMLGIEPTQANLCVQKLPQKLKSQKDSGEFLWAGINLSREEFYLKSAEYVDSLTEKDFWKIMGNEAIAEYKQIIETSQGLKENKNHESNG